MTKRFFSIAITFIFSALAVAMMLINTSAEETAKTDMIQIGRGGKITLICGQSENNTINTLQFSLEIKSDGISEVSFEFDDTLGAKIMEYRYHSDEKRLNIYISGTQPLFENTDALRIGRILAADSEGNEINVKADAIENSLKFVCDASLMEKEVASVRSGDANSDGKINISDAGFIAKMIANGHRNELPFYGDYNDDNVVNIRDAANIAMDIAKRIID